MPHYTGPTAPYRAGEILELEVTESFSQELESNHGLLNVTILEVLSGRRASVLAVSFQDQAGRNIEAVLKLYDYRYGTTSRTLPHTSETDAEHWDYVFEGKAGENHYYNEEHPASHARARSETDYHVTCVEGFRTEAKAYDELRDLQGISIPTKMSHVRLPLRRDPLLDLAEEGEFKKYFAIPGMLLQRIDGVKVADFRRNPAADPKEEHQSWEKMAQAAVDLSVLMNARGVVTDDDFPTEEVIVDSHTGFLFRIDFTSCDFKYDENDDDDNDDEDDEENVSTHLQVLQDMRWEIIVQRAEDPIKIGTAAAKMMLTHGVHIELQFPENNNYASGIKGLWRPSIDAAQVSTV